MEKEPVIILAEDDQGHAGLIMQNLKRSGVSNEILHFKDGKETLNFLLKQGNGHHRDEETDYLLLLDIRMPLVNGIEVMKAVKNDREICHIPIIVVSTMEDPIEIQKCHELGCNNYFVKPIGSRKFAQAMEELGQYINEVILPLIHNRDCDIRDLN